MLSDVHCPVQSTGCQHLCETGCELCLREGGFWDVSAWRGIVRNSSKGSTMGRWGRQTQGNNRVIL